MDRTTLATVCINLYQSTSVCSNLQQSAAGWNSAGTLLELCWNSAGTLLELCWNSAGTLPMHYQGQPDGEGQGWSIGWSIGWNSADALPGGAARGQPGVARGSQAYGRPELCRNSAGTLLELCWNSAGTLLELCWNSAGTLLENLEF